MVKNINIEDSENKRCFVLHKLYELYVIIKKNKGDDSWCNCMIDSVWHINLDEIKNNEIRKRKIMKWNKIKQSVIILFESLPSLTFNQRDIDKYVHCYT